jgi:hypothetical protein
MKLMFALVAMLIVSGCQTVPYQGVARDVKRKPGVGGTIAVPSNPRQEDRDRAAQAMISNCGNGNYKVTEEGEVVTGETTQASTRNDYRHSTQHQSGSFLGMPIVSGDPAGTDSSTTATKTQLKEWQIAYECSPAAPMPPSAAPAPAPRAMPKKKKK